LASNPKERLRYATASKDAGFSCQPGPVRAWRRIFFEVLIWREIAVLQKVVTLDQLKIAEKTSDATD